MRKLDLEQMESIEGGGWIDGVGCGAGIVMVFAAAGVNFAAFVAGVVAIDQYCGNVL